MGFGNSEQNFGMIASKFTVAMWYTDLIVYQQSKTIFSWFQVHSIIKTGQCELPKICF